MKIMKSFTISIVFISIFVFTNALFINWSSPTNFCVAIGLSWFTITLWKWTCDIIAFKKSGMKLPEEPEKEDRNKKFLNDIVTNPAFADFDCNVWHGTAEDRTSAFWTNNSDSSSDF